MAINTIDIARIFKDTWGFVGLPFPEIIVRGIPTRNQTTFAGSDFPNIRPWSERRDKSAKGVSYRVVTSGGAEAFLPIWLSEQTRNALEYLLPNTMLSMTSRKNIVKTNLVNRDGSVKEEISMNDWELRIRGVLVSTDNNYPESEKQLLVEWYKKRKALNIQNVKTSICLDDHERVVIEELSFPEIRGFENTQPYEMLLSSDTEFSLYIE